jgi:hypothetical protein
MTTPLDTIHDDCEHLVAHKFIVPNGSSCPSCRDRNIEANAIERTKAGIAEELLGYKSANGIDSWPKVHQAAQIALDYEETHPNYSENGAIPLAAESAHIPNPITKMTLLHRPDCSGGESCACGTQSDA